jgi:phosphoadenosine phosphosulfate reductase
VITGLERSALLAHSRSRAFCDRVERARALISEMDASTTVVSTSWGKDSVVLMHLSFVAGLRHAVHVSSSYALPGYESVRAYFESIMHVTTLAPRLSLDEMLFLCHDLGLPHERTEQGQAGVVASIKKDYASEYCSTNGFLTCLMGMRAEESPGKRGRLFRTVGVTYKTRGITYCNPLAWWRSGDVWAYIAANELPYNNRIYDATTHGLTRAEIRNTGWLSTDGAQHGRIAWLRQHFPEQYLLLLSHFPEISSYA